MIAQSACMKLALGKNRGPQERTAEGQEALLEEVVFTQGPKND